MSELTKVSGIGRALADKLYAQGARNTSDLRKKKYFDQLPIQAQVDLKYKPLREIPHDLIAAVHEEFKKLLKGYKFDLTGSYRRGAKVSGDIDCLIISRGWSEVMSAINKSKKLKLHQPYMQGEDRMSTLMDISPSLVPATLKSKVKKNIVKIDFYRATKDNYVFNLLYSTGSKEFNIRMRSLAKNKGYLLNQNGLYKVDPKNPNIVQIIPATHEKEIFDILGMKYVPPKDRG